MVHGTLSMPMQESVLKRCRRQSRSWLWHASHERIAHSLRSPQLDHAVRVYPACRPLVLRLLGIVPMILVSLAKTLLVECIECIYYTDSPIPSHFRSGDTRPKWYVPSPPRPQRRYLTRRGACPPLQRSYTAWCDSIDFTHKKLLCVRPFAMSTAALERIY